MADTAAALVDRVLPYARYRQWVVTFPRRVRYHLAADPRLATLAHREVLRVLFAWQRRRARAQGHKPARARSNAAITFVQRFNSSLELSLHLHILIPDAVFVPDPRTPTDPDARPRIVELDPPQDPDVAALLDKIIQRVIQLLQKHGRLDDDLDEDPDSQLLLALRPARPPPAAPAIQEPLPPLCARKDGYSLHAGTSVHNNDRVGLERLCRYGLRPPLAQGRLTRAPDGTLLYLMKRRYSEGRQRLRFEPQQFLLRLCALVPPARFHMVRYSGLLAPHARGRFALTGRGLRHAPAGAAPAPTRAPTPTPPVPSRTRHPEDPDDPTRQRRLHWATLMKRTFGLDALRCPRCNGRMELIATLEDPDTAHKILTHLGLPGRPPPRPPPWRPPRSSPVCLDPSEDPPSLFE